MLLLPPRLPLSAAAAALQLRSAARRQRVARHGKVLLPLGFVARPQLHL